MADQAILEGYTEYLTAMGKAAADAAIEYKKAQLQLQANQDAIQELDQQISALKALPPAASFAEVLGVSTGAGKTKLSELQDQRAELEAVVREGQALLSAMGAQLATAQQDLATTKAALAELEAGYQESLRSGKRGRAVAEVGTAAGESTDS
jgi:chromosome segregation ATPase